MIVRLSTFLIASALVITACGDSERRLNTGLPPNTSLGDLSDAEVQQACAAAERYLAVNFPTDIQRRGECQAQAFFAYILSGGSLSACRSSMNECLAESTTPLAEVPDLACDLLSSTLLSGCSATVRDFEGCITYSMQALRLTERLVSCDLYDPNRAADISSELEAVSERMARACESLDSGEDCQPFRIDVGGLPTFE